MKIILTKIAAVILFILGVVSLVSPIPGSFIFFACSLALTISVSLYAQYCVQWIRSRSPRINKALFWLEKKTEKRIKMIGQVLPKTHPIEGSCSQKLSHKEYIKKMIEEEKLREEIASQSEEAPSEKAQE